MWRRVQRDIPQEARSRSQNYDRWGEQKIDRERIANYRFFRCGGVGPKHSFGNYVRIKVALDKWAFGYLLAAAIYIIVAHLLPANSLEGTVAGIANGFLFIPLLGVLQGFVQNWAICHIVYLSCSDVVGPQLAPVILAVLICGILLHQSLWLNYGIMKDSYVDWHFFNKGFLRDSDDTGARLTEQEQTWTFTSQVANAVFVACVALSGAFLLWTVRKAPILSDPAFLPALVFAGIILSVMGAFALLDYALGGKRRHLYYWYGEPVLAGDKRPPEHVFVQWVCGCAACVLAFGAIIGLGLHQGDAGWSKGNVLGLGLAFGTTVAQLIMRKIPDRPSSSRTSPRAMLHDALVSFGRVVLAPVLAVTYWLILVPIVALLSILLFVLAFMTRIVLMILWVAFGWIIVSLSLFRIRWRFVMHILQDEMELKWERTETIRGCEVVSGPLPGRFIARLEGRLRHGLMQGEGWLTRIVTVEPVRSPIELDRRELASIRYKNADADLLNVLARSGQFAVVDPYDSTSRIEMKPVSGKELNTLYWHSLVLTATACFVAYAIEYLVGDGIALVGGSWLESGGGLAVLFGLIVGVIVVILSSLGRSPVGGLMVGLIGGIIANANVGLSPFGTLIPPLEGVLSPLSLQFYLFVLGYFLQIHLGILGRRSLMVVGMLMLGVGIYLQFLRLA